MNIIEKIIENGNKFPDRIVMQCDDQQLTWRELLAHSAAIANYIEENTEDRGPVMVYGHKKVIMPAIFFACARSGRAYCPVDISTPDERIIDIAEKIGNPMVLASEPLNCLDSRYSVVGLDDLHNICNGYSGEEVDPSLQIEGNDTCYIIFTSGSTGKPKGVEISCDSLTFFARWMSSLSQSQPGDIFINQAPFSFDLSVMDTYTALYSGGSIFALSKDMQKDMGYMFEAMRDSSANYWVSTPSFADLCLSDRNFSSELLPQLRKFLFCGEKLSKSTVRKLMERFPNAEIINTYGPTESTVAVTGVRITEDMLEAEDELPIGAAKPGTDIIIDENNGEIIIKGDTVSKGYFKDPEKTEKVFGQEDGVRTYRTGDSGYFKDGNLYYRDRIDRQIKLHGYRMELGDIESNIMELEGVEGVSVIPEKDAEGKIRNLVAFVVKPEAEGGFKDAKAIKMQLKDKLPTYMVPKKIKFMKSLPVNANGKVDRKKLSELIRKRNA